MPKAEESNQQLKTHKIPLQGGGKEFVSECNELTNSGGGQTSPHLYTEWLLKKSNHPNSTQNNLFQGLANVTEVDELNTQTVVALVTPHQERLASLHSSSLSILSRKGRGERHPATGLRQYTEIVTLRDLKRKVVTKKENKTMKLNNNKAVAQTNSRNGLNVLTSYRLNVFGRRSAFTLAEVLITLAIIGVVAAITIPSLVKNYNEHAWLTAQDVFTKRLEVATRQMNTEEKLAGYSSTMDFVNELKKKIKITNVCDSNNLSKCFESTILTADGQEIDATNLKTSAKLAKEDWGTETVGVQFANGINALIAYNPQTDQQPFNNQFSATEASMAILYDVSGHKNPNTLGKDVNQNANVKKLGCYIKPDLVGGMCISQILVPGTGYSPMTKAECDQAVSDGELGVKACQYNDDYWAGAVKACGGINNMPTESQLIDLAKYVYNTDSINGGTSTTHATLDTEKASQFLSASPYSNSFYVWSGQESSSLGAYYRDFRYTYTLWYDSSARGSSIILAVCLDQ